MRLNWKIFRLLACLGGLFAVAGCSGVNYTHSVSPATFFLPGLMKNDVAPKPPPEEAPVISPIPDRPLPS